MDSSGVEGRGPADHDTDEDRGRGEGRGGERCPAELLTCPTLVHRPVPVTRKVVGRTETQWGPRPPRTVVPSREAGYGGTRPGRGRSCPWRRIASQGPQTSLAGGQCEWEPRPCLRVLTGSWTRPPGQRVYPFDSTSLFSQVGLGVDNAAPRPGGRFGRLESEGPAGCADGAGVYLCATQPRSLWTSDVPEETEERDWTTSSRSTDRDFRLDISVRTAGATPGWCVSLLA